MAREQATSTTVSAPTTLRHPERPAAGSAGAEPMVPRDGDVIAGKYRVDRLLGHGGMGIVLAVTHLEISEPYAIKCLRPDRVQDAGVRARFLREARAAAKIKSEHVARVSDVAQLPDGSPFIVMEYLVGEDLAALLASFGPLPVDVAIDYVLQACQGVAEAHALGFVHRDLKPSNLFLTRRSDGEPLVKVLDFGVAKEVDAPGPNDESLTQTTAVFGSTSYMSPEQTRSARHVDFRTDIWALGVILYELLAGRKPFKGETTLGTLVSIAADPPHPLRALRPEVSPELEAVVLRCLEKEVSARYQSVSELASALGRLAGAGAVSLGRIQRLARAPTGDSSEGSGSPAARSSRTAAAAAADETSRPERRWRLLAIVVPAALLAAAAAAVLAMALRTREGPRVATPLPDEPPRSAPMPSATASPPAVVGQGTSASAIDPRALVETSQPRRTVVPSKATRPTATASAPATKPASAASAPAPSAPAPSAPAPRDPAADSH